MKKINTLFYDYLWNGKPDKIKRDVIIKNYLEGGLKMIHIKSYITALKVTWIRRIYIHSGNWDFYIDSVFDKHNLASMGIEKVKDLSKQCENKFWKDVLEARYNTILASKIYKTHIMENPIWFNSEIKVERKHIFNRVWYNKGIHTINDLIKEDKEFCSLEELREKYNIHTNFLTYQSIKRAVYHFILKNQNLFDLEKKTVLPNIPINLKLILKDKKGAQEIL